MNLPPIAFNEAIVRIWDADGKVVGVGFLVGERDVLTCAHVVTQALGEADNRQPISDAEVSLDFPLIAPLQMLRARVLIWKPPQDNETDDIAGLRLSSAPPSGAKATRLVTASDLWAHPFRTFGFPARHDDGVWASGRLLSRQATGWVQLEDVKETGFRVERGFSGAPVWDDELHGVVGMAVASEARPEVRGAYLTPADALISAWPLLQAHALPPCPYRGLFAFRELDAALFFGREELTGQLVDQLIRKPLVAVVGPSGSGKSSIVFAGAIPQMRQREGWTVTSLRPATETSPLNALASALLPLLEPEMTESDRLGELPKLAAVLADGRLAEVVGRSLERVGTQRLLLVIDQFEELFGPDSAATRQFLDVLVQAVASQPQRTNSSLTVALTLRADFLGQALEHAGLAEALQRSVVAIGRMSREQLRSAIDGPVGHEAIFEAGLVDRILDDVGVEPGNLPLLEFALTLLWERQVGRVLTHASYEALGGVEGALARYAEQVYLDALPEPEQEAARRVFVQLVRPGETTEPTRRVARRTDLDEPRWRVAQHLAATRLVVTGRDAAGLETVEVVHEALISGWSRLRQWVAADHAFRVWQERLRVAVEQWEDSSRDKGALLRGAPLAEAERWEKQRQDELGSTEHAFIRASRALQSRATRRLQMVIAILGILTLATAAFGVRSKQQGDRLDREGRATLSRYLAVQSEARVNNEPDLAMLLSLAAYDTAPTREARGRLLQQADERRGVAAVLAGHLSGVTAVAFSPDGRMLASGTSDGTISLWDVATHHRVGSDLDQEGQVASLAFSPDSQILAASGFPGGVNLWDVMTHTRIATLPTGELDPESKFQMAFSPDGRILATGNVNGKVILWDLQTHHRAHTLAAGLPPYGSYGDTRASYVAFSPDGQLLATTQAAANNIILWDPRSFSRSSTITLGHKGTTASALAFSPNSKLLAWADNNRRVVLWSVKRHTRIATLRTSGFASINDITQIAFSHDSRLLASTSESDPRAINLWDIANRDVFQVLGGHIGTVTALAFSPDGQIVASASDDKTIDLLNLKDPRPLVRPTNVGSVVAVRPDGRLLAIAEPRGRISLWDIENHRRLGLMSHRARSVDSIVFSQSGRLLGSFYASGNSIRADVWNVNDGQLVATLTLEGKSYNGTLIFSPDDERLIVIANNRADLWSIAQRRRLRAPWSRAEKVTSAAFSADGKRLAWVSHNSVTIWEWTTNRRLGVINNIAGGRDIAFSQDGRLLVTSGDGDVILWDAIRQTRLGILGKGSGAVFSPDGQVVAAVGQQSFDDLSQAIPIWDTGTRVQLANFAAQGGLNRIAFSPDGKLIVIGDIIELRDLDPTLAFQHLCNVVGRELTKSEWKTLLPGREYHQLCQ